ncbi:MAG TPA: LysM peptidoglycan-binding domain-containing protein [Pseudonocardia sp.]
MSAIETVGAGSVRSAERVRWQVVGSSGRRVRRVPVGPVPVRPGRLPASARPAGPSPVRSVVGWSGAGARVGARPSAARPLSLRPARRPAVRAGSAGRLVPAGFGPALARLLLVVLVVGAAVVGLGLLADAVGSARVPDRTELVQVHQGESLWQVARRVAPSADPGEVAARIAELNGLPSPSVQAGDTLLSPIG